MFKLKKNFIFLVLTAIFFIQIPNKILANNDYDVKFDTTKQENIIQTDCNDIKLITMQNKLDKIKTQVSDKSNKNQLIELNECANKLSKMAETSSIFLYYKLQKLINQLKILGNAPGLDNNIKETLQITNKRYILENQLIKLKKQIKQFKIFQKNATLLSKQINLLQDEQIKNKLISNSGSILYLKFWMPLINSSESDKIKNSIFFHKIYKSILFAWNKKFRTESILWLILSILIPTVIKYFIKKFLIYINTKKIPKGNLRSHFFIVSNSLTIIISIVLTYNCLLLSFVRFANVDIDIKNFINQLFNIVVLCSLFYGVGRSFLKCQNTYFNFLNINTISFFSKFLYIFTFLILILQIFEEFNYTITNNLNKIIFFNGLTALLIGSSFLLISVYVNNIRLKKNLNATQLIVFSRAKGLIQCLLTLIGFCILFLLSIGYIMLSRFISYEVLLCCVLCTIFYVFKCLLNDYLNHILLHKNNNIYKNIKFFFSINDNHLQQIFILIIALIKTILVIFLIKFVFNGTLIASIPVKFFQKITEFLNNHGLGSIHLFSRSLIISSLFVAISLYLLKLIHDWLKYELFPRTNIDNGICLSLLTLFKNIGYVLIFLITLSLLGLQWNKLAWIVSALSVGIGFGLQEIVKNFISGIILLTERPVKVGDLVIIDGIEGDIKNIKIRATEIQLEDKSILIVPNSQLISQKVRNATMEDKLGIVKILLTFPLNTNLTKVKDILLNIYTENINILNIPSPLVSFLDITTKGVIVSITGQVKDYRQISIIKSDLIFNILNNLSKESILVYTTK